MAQDDCLCLLSRIVTAVSRWERFDAPPEDLPAALAGLLDADRVELGLIREDGPGTEKYVPLAAWCRGKFTSPRPSTAALVAPLDELRSGAGRIYRLEMPLGVNGPGCRRKPGGAVRALPIFVGHMVSGLILFDNDHDEETDDPPAEALTIIQGALNLKFGQFQLDKRLSDICDFMPDPTLIMEAEGAISLWNKAIAGMTGWEAERIIGRGNHINAVPFYGKRRVTLPDILLHPDPEGEKLYLELRHEDDGIYSVAFCPSLPGGGVYVSTKTSKIFDLNNRLYGAIHTVRDVTRQREMERDLQRNAKIQDAANKVSGLGMVTFSGADVVYCNQYMGQILGCGVGTVRMEHIRQLLRYVPQEEKSEARAFFDLLPGRLDQSHTLLLHLKRKNVAQFYQCYVQPDESGGENLTHLIIEDITEKRSMEEKIRLSELRLYHEDRLAALGTMAAGIAHELNQPLNGIKTECSTFLWEFEKGETITTQDFKQSIDTIYQQVERMSEVIRNVRTFAREEKALIICNADLNEAVRHVLSMVGAQLRAHGVRLRESLEDRSLNVKAGMSQLEQVIMNLVVNARQALEETSGVERTITLKTKLVDREVFLYIEDNGPGIPRKLRGKVFDPFFTTKDPGKGTGLGLAISQSIARDLGGELELIGSSHQGTAFSLRLPLNG